MSFSHQDNQSNPYHIFQQALCEIAKCLEQISVEINNINPMGMDITQEKRKELENAFAQIQTFSRFNSEVISNPSKQNIVSYVHALFLIAQNILVNDSFKKLISMVSLYINNNFSFILKAHVQMAKKDKADEEELSEAMKNVKIQSGNQKMEIEEYQKQDSDFRKGM